MNFSQSNNYQKQNRQTPYNNAYFNSIPQLLGWASNILDLEIASLDHMATGAIFCQLLDACHPGSVRMNMINWKANCETDYISNFKIFQQGLIKNNIDKTININRLAKGKQNELNELLQWIYGYYCNYKDNYNGVYNAKRKRNGQSLIFKKNNIKQKYKIKYKDNNSQYSFSSNKSISSDINSQRNDYCNNNYNMYKNNNYNNSRSKENIIFNNELQKRFNMNNNNFSNNQIQNNRIRNKSKVETTRYYDFEEKVLYHNHSNNNIFHQNKRNINNNKYKNSKPKNVNNIFNNNKNNNINNNNNYNNGININNPHYSRNRNMNNYNMDNKNVVGGNNNNLKRNFPNILQKNNNFEFEQNTYSNQINQSNDDSSQHYVDNDTNINIEEDNNSDDKELDISDFLGLSNDDLKYIAEEEKKDGNKVKDLKKIIRKLRIAKISNEKELNNVNNILNSINKLKNFYLNKLKDIEYLYFNPVIQNSNDNKNCILRQLLCSDEDTTIYIDENNYAFLPNKKNDEINMKGNYFHKFKSQPQSSKKDILDKSEINNTISNNNNINTNEDYTNKNKKNKNYSSKKNYNNNYINNMFDSLNKNDEKINQYNNNMNIPNNYNNINISNNIINSYNTNITRNNTQLYNESQTDNISNFNNSNYNCNQNIKTKAQKIIPIKLSNNSNNIRISSSNISQVSISNINTHNNTKSNINYNINNDTDDSSFQKENLDFNSQINYKQNNFENEENLKNNNFQSFSIIKQKSNSERKNNDKYVEDTYINKTEMGNKTQLNYKIYNDISSQLINDPLNLKCLK